MKHNGAFVSETVEVPPPVVRDAKQMRANCNAALARHNVPPRDFFGRPKVIAVKRTDLSRFKK